ncbi:hypothetical protein [Paenibacillus tuaregi]|nr:hypothetical protein [Paenibacillus tuaregi]
MMVFNMTEDELYTIAFYILLAVGILALGGWLLWLNKKAKSKR